MSPAASRERPRSGAKTAPATPAGRAAGHRRTLTPKTAPRAPRRVSGPRGGRIAIQFEAPGSRRARGNAPRFRLPLPRRPSRPQLAPPQVMLASLGALVRSLPDHRLLDRIVRGRAWIPLLGLMLAGIVFMQVEVLKLGASIGRSIQTATALQSRNELLRANVASLADDIRIERTAAKMGMVMPAPSTVGFLYAKHGSARQAVANIHAPDATTFLAQLALSAAATAPSPTGTATANGVSTDGTVVSSSGLAVTGTSGTSGSSVTAPSTVASTPTSTSAASTPPAATTQLPTSSTAAAAPTGTSGSATAPITTGTATPTAGTAPTSSGSTGSSSGGAGMTGG